MPFTTSILCRLQHQHDSLPELIWGFSEDQLKQRTNPGKWSVFENLAHLTAYQPVFLQRLQLIEHTESPLFERYVGDDDPVFQRYLDQPPASLLEDYATQRFLLINHLTRLGETLLRREGRHPLYGSFNICQWTDFFLLHEAHHLFTIFMLTASLRNRIAQ